MNKAYCYQSLVLKEQRAICKFSRLLLKYRSDQVKKIKFADSCIPWERGSFMLLPLTYQNLGFHTLKIETSKLVKVLWKDSYLRVVFHMIHVSTLSYYF